MLFELSVVKPFPLSKVTVTLSPSLKSSSEAFKKYVVLEDKEVIG